MSECSLYGKIVQHTKAAFGRGLSPHLFRDCALTTLGEENPEHVWLGISLLHHSDPRIAEAHYNQAKDASAVRAYQDALVADRRRARRHDRKRRSRPRGGRVSTLEGSRK